MEVLLLQLGGQQSVYCQRWPFACWVYLVHAINYVFCSERGDKNLPVGDIKPDLAVVCPFAGSVGLAFDYHWWLRSSSDCW
jgi:hypothetical protein